MVWLPYHSFPRNLRPFVRPCNSFVGTIPCPAHVVVSLRRSHRRRSPTSYRGIVFCDERWHLRSTRKYGIRLEIFCPNRNVQCRDFTFFAEVGTSSTLTGLNFLRQSKRLAPWLYLLYYCSRNVQYHDSTRFIAAVETSSALTNDFLLQSKRPAQWLF